MTLRPLVVLFSVASMAPAALHAAGTPEFASSWPAQNGKATAGATQSAPAAAGTTPDFQSAARMLALLFLGVSIAGGCVWYWRRSMMAGIKNSTASIDLLAARAMGPRQKVALIQTCGERLLLSLTEKEITVLAHLPNEADLVKPDSSAGPASSGPAPVEPATDQTPARVAQGQGRRFEVVP